MDWAFGKKTRIRRKFMADGRGKIFGVVLILALFLVATTGMVWAEELKIGAGAAPSENIFKKIKDPMGKEISLKLILIDSGPYDALVALDKGEVDAAAGGLSFGDWLKMMAKKGYNIPDKNAYKYRVIGKDIIKVIANKDVKVQQLSKEQLQGIFTGKITNWKDAGGPDLPIVVVFGAKIPGTQAVFQKLAMNGEAYAKNMKEATNAPDVKEKVKATPGAVGLAPATLVDDTVSVPKIPEVGRPITLITKGEPSATVIKMLEYIRGPGKKHLGK
jgi:phosphate transport system substrate-binding protein